MFRLKNIFDWMQIFIDRVIYFSIFEQVQRELVSRCIHEGETKGIIMALDNSQMDELNQRINSLLNKIELFVEKNGSDKDKKEATEHIEEMRAMLK
jgi:histidyl-tRNA synthetase